MKLCVNFILIFLVFYCNFTSIFQHFFESSIYNVQYTTYISLSLIRLLFLIRAVVDETVSVEWKWKWKWKFID